MNSLSLFSLSVIKSNCNYAARVWANKQMGMYGIYTIHNIIYNIWAHLPLALHFVAVAVDKLNFCAALFVAVCQFASWLCNIFPFQSLYCTVRMLQVVTFNLIKSLLRKSKINALLFNSNKQRNFCCLHCRQAKRGPCISQIRSAVEAQSDSRR